MPHGDIECGQIIVDKLAPFSFSSEIETTLFDFLDVRSILLAESQDGVHDSVRYLKIIEIRTINNLYALAKVISGYRFLRPHTETGQIGRDRRYTESDTFQRGISPRLVVGRIYGSVHPYQHIIIGLIENTSFTVQITRNEYDL